ncbi:MAG: hypothetical protein J1E28_02910, partial [Helicobacter sp.]|nr:hypothetical protein [Helicobacter sp.]
NYEDIPALDTESEGESSPTPTQSSEDTLEGELGDIGAELDEAAGDTAEEASTDVENVESDMPSETDTLDALGEELEDLGEGEIKAEPEATDEANAEEAQTEAEENIDDMLEEGESTPPVLDKEQVSEVSQALNALDEQSGNEDFNSLKEPDVAHALGEEVEGEELADIGQDELSEADESMAQDSQEQALDVTKQEDGIEQKSNGETSQEFVKNIIANSVQSSITSLHSDNFKSMLDGLEVTINISFKDKSK